MVLKSSIHSSALPQQQRVTQNEYFSLISHTKQLLLVTFCDTTAGVSIIFRTHGRTHGGGRTDRRGSRNSYLNECTCSFNFNLLELIIWGAVFLVHILTYIYKETEAASK